VSEFEEKQMKKLVASAIAIAATGFTLGGCASYDYGSGYAYGQPYTGYYGYDDGPYSSDRPYYDGHRWRGNDSGSAAPWPSRPDDPWGGTNKPNDRNSQP
jgi:hypothetical protein